MTFPLLTIVRPKYLAASCFLIIVFWVISLLRTNNGNPQKINGEYRVVNTLKSGLIINNNDKYIYLRTHFVAYPGDTIKAFGNVKPITGDIKNYFMSINVHHSVLFPQKIELISKSNDFRNTLYRFVDKNDSLYANYTNLLLLGRKTIQNQDLYENIIKINIVHLFVISGFHFGLIYICLKKVLDKFVNQNVSIVVVLIFLTLYAYILRFSIPTQRSLILIILISVSKIFNWNIEKIKLLNLTLLIVMLINLNVIFSHSFYLTFTATYILLFLNEIKFKNLVTKAFVVSLVIYLSFIPYTTYVNNYISIFGILFGYLFTPLVPILYIFTLLFWWLPKLLINIDFIFDLIIKFLNEIAIIIKIKSFESNILKITYSLVINLFIIYSWLDYFMAKKHI